MNAPVPEMIPATEDATAEALLGSLKSISAAERRKHASVFNYWLSIRGKRSLPPIRDLDPLEIADAGPVSLLLEVIGGGDDAVVRHIGQLIKTGNFEHVTEAPSESLLATVAAKLPIVAATRQPFAFEEEFEGVDGPATCWVTLLPFSQSGTWIDYVYGFVSLDPAPGVEGEQAIEPELEAAPVPVPEPDMVDQVAPEPAYEHEAITEAEAYVAPEVAAPVFEEPEHYEEAVPETPKPRSTKGRAGFSAKFFESLASVGGFYGTTVDLDPDSAKLPEPDDHWSDPEPDPGIAPEIEAEHEPEPEAATEAVVEAEPEPEIAPEPVAVVESEPEPMAEATAQPEEREVSAEGTLQSKLSEVRAKADEARAAKLRANAALYEGLSAVYDFALDAESEPEEYLKLVEGKGLKIQLRSPMTPVVRLAFDGMCDDATIGQLEAVLAWALKNDLPRGSLAERIETEGGIAPIIGMAKAA